ncbi:Fc.00g079760.m01.CDS01 [Cosmosporella sp. VM-42]
MFPCHSGHEAAWTSTSKFCATITDHGKTATSYPIRVTDACGHAPKSYISACSCGLTCTPQPPKPTCAGTPRPRNAVYYNDFECEFPTVVEVNDVAVRYGDYAPGLAGRKVFEVFLVDTHWDATFPLWARFNGIASKKGAPVRLTFQIIFIPGADAGGVRIEADGELQQFFFAPLELPIWSLVTVDYTPKSHTTNFSIGFALDSSNAHLRVYNMLLNYLDD